MQRNQEQKTQNLLSPYFLHTKAKELSENFLFLLERYINKSIPIEMSPNSPRHEKPLEEVFGDLICSFDKDLNELLKSNDQVKTIKNQFVKLVITFIKVLEEYFTMNTHPKKTSEALEIYIIALRTFIQKADNINNLINKKARIEYDELNYYFKGILTKCDEQEKKLATMANILIYEVYIPKKLFDSEHEEFFYPPRFKVAAVAVGTFIGALFGLASPSGPIPDVRHHEAKLTPPDAIRDDLVEMANRWANSMKHDIEPEWITRLVECTPKINNNGQIELEALDTGMLNPKALKKYDEKEFVKLWLVDGTNTHELFEYGTQYMMRNPQEREQKNPHGHVVVFKDLKSAYAFSKSREDGLMYDVHGGWRRHHNWKPEEREEVRNAFNNEDKDEDEVAKTVRKRSPSA